MLKHFFSLLTVLVFIAAIFCLQRSGRIVVSTNPPRFIIPKPQYFKAAAASETNSLHSILSTKANRTVKEPVGSPIVRVSSIESHTQSPNAFDHEPDRVLANISRVPMPGPSLSFDGLSNFDNLAAFNIFFLPPDTSGDVGPSNYVQAVNALLRVFDKGGNPLTPPFKFSSIMSSLGTVCSSRDDGEPTVLYDPLADRWLLSEYCNNFPPFRQMIAVSKTGDPTGAYFTYEFVMPNVRLNDFAKFGVWPDGYYMSTEEFLGSDYAGSGIFAFDRRKMLVGDPSAGFIYFSVQGTSADRHGGFLPSDIDGSIPPHLGEPITFASYSATEYGDSEDAIRLFDFHSDFSHPELSTFIERPESPIAVAAFDPTSLSGRADIGQPAPGAPLDSNSDRLMSRVAYRNFGPFESLVLNQTVRTTAQTDPYRAGVRVYRLRRSASAYTVDEQSTIGDTSSSRWIGSAAEDGQGDLAVGYNFVSDEKVPSIVYTGRLASDPPGSFRSEAKLVNGSGVQTAFGFRWGDWSSMNVDPANDCTFWMTGEYFTAASQAFSDFTWLTRIGSFTFSECTSPPRGHLIVNVVDDSNGQSILNATVEISAPTLAPYVRQTVSDGNTGLVVLPPDTYSIDIAAAGFRSQTIQTAIAADTNDPTTVSVRLQPVPVIENTSVSFLAESCLIDQAAEPGETVTISASFRNIGSRAVNDLRIGILNQGNVISTTRPESFGALAPGGTALTRQFTFTVSSGAACGEPVTLTLHLADGRSDLGNIQVPILSGQLKVALSENFDKVGSGLPVGWSTSAVGGQEPWTSSSVRSQSPANSAFSPGPDQVGVNELVTPNFTISSTDAALTFRNFYDLEATFLRNRLFDGAVLEIKINSGDWQDIIAAGGEFESGGYDGIIDSCCQNPLAGRRGWSGTSGGTRPAEFETTRVRLPASAAGQSVQLRWRVGTDTGTFREGQYIDDVLVTDGFSCGCLARRQN